MYKKLGPPGVSVDKILKLLFQRTWNKGIFSAISRLLKNVIYILVDDDSFWFHYMGKPISA